MRYAVQPIVFVPRRPPPVTRRLAIALAHPAGLPFEPTGRQPFGQCRTQTRVSGFEPLLRNRIVSEPLRVNFFCDHVAASA